MVETLLSLIIFAVAVRISMLKPKEMQEKPYRYDQKGQPVYERRSTFDRYF